jgi:putative DNA primase/helicase
VWVLGDGAFAVLPPRAGYHWADGAKAAMSAGITEATDALRMRLQGAALITGVESMHPDAPWRTRPGTPLVGGDPRSYTRRGDVRRLVDHHGDRMLYTPGLGWRVWTESGWGGVERSEVMLRSHAMDLPDVHLAEAAALKARKEDAVAKKATSWAARAQQRATSSILGDLQSDERILVPGATHWDAEGWIAGLPVTSGVGRLVNLQTGAIELDARTRRVSKTMGAPYEEGPGGDLKRLWDLGLDGGAGRFFVKYISDLEDQHGPDWVRLLQRAAGASLYGRRGVTGDTDTVIVLKGPSRSGKSTFAECLLAVAGAYGKAVSANLLFGDRGNPEFGDAALFGYRVMTLSEPPQNAELNTTKLKQLSGGDTITGRPPYAREEITFVPEVTLWLSTNHALEISDEAVWRRLKIFAFEHAWDEGKGEVPELRKAVTQDPSELRLAFAWMLRGAMDWYRDGWGDTTVWRETGALERAKHDPVSRWVNECVEVTGSTADTFTHGDMMGNFDMWLIMSAETKPSLSRNALRDELEGACVRGGLRIDKARRALIGGRLV